MQAISGKHIVEEINGIRCSVVDKAATEARASFIEQVLTHNGYTVQKEVNARKPKDPEDAPTTLKIGVTDITFCLPVAIYLKQLKTPGSNEILTDEKWMQQTNPLY